MAVQRGRAATACRQAACKTWKYLKANYWELSASVLEAATLVLIVFFQDVAFKEIIVTSAALLTVSFCLHGVAYRAGQCQKWPKVIEIVAPLLFYGLIPAAYLATQITYKTVFIIINYWFILWQSVFWVALGRNFMQEYLEDWNPRQVWDTPLVQHCARIIAVSWMICEAVMGSVQIFVVIFNISLATNAVAAVMLCYVMQLLPLLWAVIFTFVYPAHIKRKWGYQYGIRQTCFSPPQRPHENSSSSVQGLLPSVGISPEEGGSTTGELSGLDLGLVVEIHSAGDSSSNGTKKDTEAYEATFLEASRASVQLEHAAGADGTDNASVSHRCSVGHHVVHSRHGNVVNRGQE